MQPVSTIERVCYVIEFGALQASVETEYKSLCGHHTKEHRQRIDGRIATAERRCRWSYWHRRGWGSVLLPEKSPIMER